MLLMDWYSTATTYLVALRPCADASYCTRTVVQMDSVLISYSSQMDISPSRSREETSTYITRQYYVQ
jgi:hypothetical protein